MQPDAPALLWDAREAARLILMFIEGGSWQHYQADDELVWQAATTRVPGLVEALDQLLDQADTP